MEALLKPDFASTTLGGPFQATIRRIASQEDLSTYDPYDVWKTKPGIWLKRFYNRAPRLALVPVGIVTLFDTYVNNERRVGYKTQEYPIVRALATLTLIEIYERTSDRYCLEKAKEHLNWLIEHSSRGYSGLCWGLNFQYPVTSTIEYGPNMPLTTMTPYVLEALVRYTQITGETTYVDSIRSIFLFFWKDVKLLNESETAAVTSYSADADRIVINAVSYAMYSLALTLPYITSQEAQAAVVRIGKLYNYIVQQQRDDGAWLYSPEGISFIDGFHSCLVVKNLVKASRLVRLTAVEACISKAYQYILDHLYDAKRNLCLRFSEANKPSLVAFDLYDSAELLNLAILRQDRSLVLRLSASISRTFIHEGEIYSQIDRGGRRRNRNTLRWAVMPLLYAASQIESGDALCAES